MGDDGDSDGNDDNDEGEWGRLARNESYCGPGASTPGATMDRTMVNQLLANSTKWYFATASMSKD